MGRTYDTECMEKLQVIEVIVKFSNIVVSSKLYKYQSVAINAATQIHIVAHLHKYTIIYHTSS